MTETITLRRARPWLGTLVEIQVSGLPDADLLTAVDAAYREVAVIHNLLSFHNVESDLSRLNREAAIRPQQVHPHTLQVVNSALLFASASAGVFDPCVAASLVADGCLPHPPNAPTPHPQASWRDVRIDGEGRIRFDCPLWMDFGGIAKGYAVDCAVETLQAAGVSRGCVNAGGDLRVFGTLPQTIHLRMPRAATFCLPALEIVDGAVASSASYFEASERARMHRHGVGHAATDPACAAVVAAPTCMVADTLTKIVLADPATASILLGIHSAEAQRYDGEFWRTMPFIKITERKSISANCFGAAAA
ncbi:MAG: FAD:protein FMN transferase [Tahibacter sp.]